MLIFLIRIFTLSLGISIIINRSPISLGVWILILSIIISLICRRYLFSWFGYITFLIYIGGLLVIFSYFAAIQPNQHINISTPFSFFILSCINLPINMYPVLLDLFRKRRWWVSCIFYINNVSIILILGLILFLAIIRVVKITSSNLAPLRPFK